MMSENPLNSSAASNTDDGDRNSYVAFQDKDDRGRKSTQANSNNIFSDEDWEKIHLLEDYLPPINGALNKEYIDLRAKMQNELGISVSTNEEGKQMKLKDVYSKFVHVPVEVVKDRTSRIMENETLNLQIARENKYYIADKTCDEIITKHGEEILCKIHCVAILNAPQTGQDHHGDCRLFLTRAVRNNVPYYRIFFYAYGEAALYDAEESTEVRHKQWVEIFQNMVCLNVRSNYGLQAEHNHRVRRDVLAEFITVGVDDVLGIHHRVADYFDIKRLSKYEAVREEKESKYLEAKCCFDMCGITCPENYTECLTCCPKEFMNIQFWKWSLHEEKRIDLSAMVCREETKVEQLPEVILYDPYKQHTVPMKSDTETRTTSRRYHTLNLTCIDPFETNRKYSTVIVLHPDAETSGAMEFMCQVNVLLDEVRARKFARFGSDKDGELSYHKWLSTMKVDERHPFEEYQDVQAQIKNLLMDLWRGGLNIKIEVSWPYYYNLILLIVFSFIGMIACFVAATFNGIYAVNGVYSLLHWGNRIYNLNQREYVATTLYKDVFVAFIGMVLAGIVAAMSPENSTEQAGTAFTFLQAIFTAAGAAYQLYLHLKKRAGDSIFFV
jgi:hypothetical protein